MNDKIYTIWYDDGSQTFRFQKDAISAICYRFTNLEGGERRIVSIIESDRYGNILKMTCKLIDGQLALTQAVQGEGAFFRPQ